MTMTRNIFSSACANHQHAFYKGERILLRALGERAFCFAARPPPHTHMATHAQPLTSAATKNSKYSFDLPTEWEQREKIITTAFMVSHGLCYSLLMCGSAATYTVHVNNVCNSALRVKQSEPSGGKERVEKGQNRRKKQKEMEEKRRKDYMRLTVEMVIFEVESGKNHSTRCS